MLALSSKTAAFWQNHILAALDGESVPCGAIARIFNQTHLDLSWVGCVETVVNHAFEIKHSKRYDLVKSLGVVALCRSAPLLCKIAIKHDDVALCRFVMPFLNNSKRQWVDWALSSNANQCLHVICEYRSTIRSKALNIFKPVTHKHFNHVLWKVLSDQDFDTAHLLLSNRLIKEYECVHALKTCLYDNNIDALAWISRNHDMTKIFKNAQQLFVLFFQSCTRATQITLPAHNILINILKNTDHRQKFLRFYNSVQLNIGSSDSESVYSESVSRYAAVLSSSEQQQWMMKALNEEQWCVVDGLLMFVDNNVQQDIRAQVSAININSKECPNITRFLERENMLAVCTQNNNNKRKKM